MNTTTKGAWTIHVTPNEGRPTVRLRAIHANRRWVITEDKLTEDDAASFDPDASWAFACLKAGI